MKAKILVAILVTTLIVATTTDAYQRKRISNDLYRDRLLDMLQMELKRRDFGSDRQEFSRDRFQRRKLADEDFDDDDDNNDEYERSALQRRKIVGQSDDWMINHSENGDRMNNEG